MKDIAEVVWVGFVEIKLYNDYKLEKFLMLYMSLKFQNKICGVNIKDFHHISLVGNVYMLMAKVLANLFIKSKKKNKNKKGVG